RGELRGTVEPHDDGARPDPRPRQLDLDPYAVRADLEHPLGRLERRAVGALRRRLAGQVGRRGRLDLGLVAQLVARLRAEGELDGAVGVAPRGEDQREGGDGGGGGAHSADDTFVAMADLDAVLAPLRTDPATAVVLTDFDGTLSPIVD